MKLLEICRSYYPSIGGLEKFVYQRLKIYDDLNIEYQILTTNYSTEKVDNGFHQKVVKYLDQYTKYNFTPNLAKDLFHQYDIVSVNQIGNYLSDFSIILASKLKKRIILTPHLYFHTGEHSKIKSIHKKLFAHKILEKVSDIICFTDYEKYYWENKFGVEKERLVKIPHYYNPQTEGKLNKYNKSSKYILYLGRFYSNKKIELLIKSFNKLAGLNFLLILTINESEIPKELKIIVNNDSRIKLLGYINEERKKELLASCEAVILPSDYEAFGIVCLEASSYKKPLLCSDLPVLNEILNNKGVIFFQNNELSIMKALEKFNSLKKTQLETMGDINYENLENFNFNHVSKLYKALLYH